MRCCVRIAPLVANVLRRAEAAVEASCSQALGIGSGQALALRASGSSPPLRLGLNRGNRASADDRIPPKRVQKGRRHSRLDRTRTKRGDTGVRISPDALPESHAHGRFPLVQGNLDPHRVTFGSSPGSRSRTTATSLAPRLLIEEQGRPESWSCPECAPSRRRSSLVACRSPQLCFGNAAALPRNAFEVASS